MNEWREAQATLWNDQAFVLNASMQSLMHATLTICVSLLDSGSESTDVNFRRIRKALADQTFMAGLIERRSLADAAGVPRHVRGGSLASYRSRFLKQAGELEELLAHWSGPALAQLRTFRNKMLAHTTTKQVVVTKGLVWRAETAVIKAATLAQYLFTDGGVDLEDDRRIGREHTISALENWGKAYR